MMIEQEAWFLNFYECPEFGAMWESKWTSQCDDECPSCGLSSIQPYESQDI